MRCASPTARRRQRGVALLTAILVVAVATVIATNLLWLSTLDLRRTGSTLALDQELQFVLGAEAWVGDILQQDLEDSSESDHLGEVWATQIEPLPIEGGFIYGSVVDLRSLDRAHAVRERHPAEDRTVDRGRHRRAPAEEHAREEHGREEQQEPAERDEEALRSQ